MADDPLTACTTCEAPVQRVFRPPAVHFKGSGFYTTDYGRAKSSGNSDSSSSTDGKSDSDSSGGEGGKGDSKAGKASEGLEQGVRFEHRPGLRGGRLGVERQRACWAFKAPLSGIATWRGGSGPICARNRTSANPTTNPSRRPCDEIRRAFTA